MIYRDYNPEKDKEALQRIWIECGWIEDEKKDKEALDIFTSTSRCKIAEVNGSAECLVMTSPGKMKYGNSDLSLSAISSVTVSRILRKQGAAPGLLASMIRDEIEKGTAVTGLGMFEQGFYNRLGFATMGYEHWYCFDPSRLKIFKKGGIPERISTDDYLDAHRCYIEAEKHHGNVTLDPPELFQAEMKWTTNGFGLGYKTAGKLSHYLWMGTKNVENGPYNVHWMAYSNWDQFLELMGLIRSLEEQVRTVEMKEPAFVQLQDFIDRPFQLQTITEKSKFESRMRSVAYQQLRINNLKSCIEAVEYKGGEFAFNLSLIDPINDFLEKDKQIEKCTGDFTVQIGGTSSIRSGHRKGLPHVRGSINGFTRLWIGVLPAMSVDLVEDLIIEDSLKRKLTEVFYRPYARSDWNY